MTKGERYAGLNIKDIVMPSINLLALKGNKDNILTATELLSGILGGTSYDLASVRSMTGLTNIPVCYEPEDGIISAIDTTDSRNFPCNCGDNPHPGKQSSQSRLGRFQEQEDFNLALGTPRIHDYERFCSHQQDCNKAHRHLFDTCGKTNNHKVV